MGTKNEEHINRIPVIKASIRSTLDKILQSNYFCTCPSEEKLIQICVGTPPTSGENVPDKFYVQITEEDKRELVNLATALYLRAWLENDSKARETLNYYAAHGFCLKSNRVRYDGDQSNPNVRSKFLGAKNKYKAMMGFKNEGIVKDYPAESNNLPPKSKRGQKEEFGLIDLCFIQWVSDHSFLFYDLLVDRVNLLEVTTPGKEPNEALREAYSKYFNAIHDAKQMKVPLGVKEDARNRNMRYVITAFMLQKIESTFQHITSMYLAHSLSFACQYSVQNVVLLTTPWWARYDYPSSLRTDSTSNQLFDVLSCERMNTMLYHQHCADSLFNKLSQNNLDGEILENTKRKSILHQATALYQTNRQVIMRSLLLDVFLDLNKKISPKNIPNGEDEMHPLCGHPNWTTKDFDDAVSFFKEDYPIIEKHPSERFGDPNKWSDETCNAIRNFYQLISPFALDDLRNNIRKHNL